MSETKVDQSFCARNGKKLVIVFVILCVVAYVIVDILTQACTFTEAENAREFRVVCGGGNSTVFTCVSNGDNTWTQQQFDGVDVCTKASSCVNVGVTTFLRWIQENPAIGAILFSIVYIAATVLFIPGSLLTIGAGVAFASAFNLGVGVLIGTVCVLVGAGCGCTLAFLLGRFLFRDWVEEQVKKYKKLEAIDRAIQLQGLKTVLLLRLSPALPYNVFNYLMGATSVSLSNYVVGSIVGFIPGTTAYVFIGAALGSAASTGDINSCNPDRTLELIIIVIGVIATLAAVTLISYYAKKELDKITTDNDAGKTAGDATAVVDVTEA